MGSIGSKEVEAKTYALFHGSPNADIEEFDITRAGSNTSSGEHFLFFTDSRQQAEDFSYEIIPTDSMFFHKRGKQGKVYEVEVTMRNPLDFSNLSDKDIQNIIKLSDLPITADDVKKFSELNNQILKTYVNLDRIKEFGYDGFIAKMNREGDKEYAVIDSKQAKIKKR